MMKRFAGIVITLIILIGFSQTAAAQLSDVPSPERQAERMTEVMAERLELTDQQRQKVLDLNIGLAEKKGDLLENEELDFWERLEELKQIPGTRAEKLRSILNDRQYQKYQALNDRKRQDTE